MLSTLAEIQQYFKNIADQHPDIKGVVVGDSEQISSVDRSKLDYPVLWLETPTVSWKMGQNARRNYDFYFVVLWNSSTDNWDHQQYILNQTLIITEQILSKIREDFADEILMLSSNSAASDPILGYGHDHDYGWRTRISIDGYMITCAPTCKFPTACQPGKMASFTWQNNNVGSFTDLIVTDTSTFVPGQDAQWTWQIDDADPVESTTPPPANLGEGDFILITLKLIDDKCIREASAVFSNKGNCGSSVPYIVLKEYC